MIMQKTKFKRTNYFLLILIINLLFSQIDYNTEIQPIFSNNCGGCHITNSASGLNLSTYENVMAGSSNNGSVIKLVDPQLKLLI